MRDFIKKQIQERMNVASKNNESVEEVSNETILEYASLFQELDDLSLEGTEAGNTRKLGIEIPLDDEAELETVEFDIPGGKVKDVPDTASIQESYDGMKTFDQFYQEAYESLTRLPRESDGGFERRVTELAEQMYNEYCADAEACGYFGFDKINISDEKVPSKINVNFGAMSEGSNDNFVTKVNTFFATDAEHNITKKQLDSVNLVKQGALKNIGTSLKAYMESNYDVPADASVWDICTPKTIIVPKGNADSFCVVVEYTNELTGKNEYFGWTAPVSSKNDESADAVTMESCERFNMESFINETQYENHDKFIQESAIEETNERLTRRVRPKRFFQEAIDLGGEGGSSEGGNEGGGDAAPSGDDLGGDAPAEGGDTSAEGGDAATTDAEGGEKKDNTAAVNNVSSEIAEKVANDTQNDAEANDEQVTFSDDEVNPDSNVGTADGGLDDTPVEDDITGDESVDGANDTADDMLNDLDNSTGDEDLGDESLDEEPLEEQDPAEAVENIDDLSVNELLKMGTESLKNMKVGDLKSLIASGDDEAIQEAFVITPKNVNKEVDFKLRECLGILNDKNMTADKLLGKFKITGHKLNRLLSKAAKMTKVYSSDEVGSIKKLNTALGELLLALRKRGAENYGSAIKGKIKDFNKEAKVVAAIVEDKMGKNTTDSVVMQEAFLLSNINDKLTKTLIPVKADMSDLSEKYQAGQLTRGRLIKKYSSSTNEMNSNMGGWQDSTITGYSKHAKNIDSALKLLNKALRKKTVDKAELIEKLADKLDIVSDYIETVIDDKNENKEYVNMVGKLAGEIVDLIDQFTGDSDAPAPVEPEVEEPVETTPEDDTTPAETEEAEVAEVEIPEDDEGIEEEPEEGDED